MALKEKQIRVATITLGVVGIVLVGVILFNLLKDKFVSASNIAPKDVAISKITQTSAKVTWTTDSESQSVIEYGTSPTSLTFFAPESTKTKNHEVELNLLTPETTYYFQISTADKKFSNGGVPWTLTTLGESSLSPTPPQTTISPSPDTSVTPTLANSTPTNSITSTPSSTPSPSEPVVKDTVCNIEDYKTNFNTNNAKYDQNDDGIVRSNDWSICAANKKTTPTPTNNP
ncbi:MAG: fibronectin type III domain-containing protein [Candidatus Roizmanbacteria bacterium]|nr:fibronectin type III domain-containing protein [Candidatus Roizmanbacteria bacterium]